MNNITTINRSNFGLSINYDGKVYCERNPSEKKDYLELLMFFSDKVQCKLYSLPFYTNLDVRGNIIK